MYYGSVNPKSWVPKSLLDWVFALLKPVSNKLTSIKISMKIIINAFKTLPEFQY